MSEVEELVHKLRSFRSRKDAMDRLVESGEEAVRPLLAALESRTEGMRWAAMRCLGERGDPRAVGPLIARLDFPVDRDTACWALGRLTGRDFGADADAWRQWYRRSQGKGQEGQQEPRGGTVADNFDDEALFAEAVRGLTASVQETGGARLVHVTLESGRRQTVRVVLSARDLEGEAAVLVYSECGPANPRFYESALRLNLSLPYAALALRQVEGEKRLVMFNTLLRKGLAPLALRKSIVTVASKADAVEKRLTGEDRR